MAVSYSDVPAGITGIVVNQALHSLAGTLAAPNLTPELTVTAGTASGMLSQATLAASKAVTSTTLDFGAGEIGGQLIIDLAPISASYALDVGVNALHEYTTSPVYAAATHNASWTEAATGVDPDFHVSELAISRTAGESENQWQWIMAVPRTGTTVTFPTLPTDIFDYNAGATDTVSVIGLDGYKVPGGYDALRAFVFTNVDPVTELGVAGQGTHESLLSSVVSARAVAFRRAAPHDSLAMPSSSISR